MGGRGCAGQRGIKGGEWDNCNSIINKYIKIFLKKNSPMHEQWDGKTHLARVHWPLAVFRPKARMVSALFWKQETALSPEVGCWQIHNYFPPWIYASWNATLHIFPSRVRVYFLTPWIWAGISSSQEALHSRTLSWKVTLGSCVLAQVFLPEDEWLWPRRAETSHPSWASPRQGSPHQTADTRLSAAASGLAQPRPTDLSTQSVNLREIINGCFFLSH